jgi:SSS family solute:Na+ symporter
MDRMLHRGAYAAIRAEVGGQVPSSMRRNITWGKIIGYDDNFTLGDKWLAGGLFGWSILWLVITIVVLTWNYFQFWSVAAWSNYYYFMLIGVGVFFALTVGTWLTWGGITDSIALFKQLRAERINPLDNGAVINHQNLDEAALPDAESPLPLVPDKPAEPVVTK